MPFEHDREFYRLVYPLQAAPKFLAASAQYRVVDIGEGGFRYAVGEGEGAVPFDGDEVSGTIIFAEEDPLEVHGVVVRYRDGEVAVHCQRQRIPLAIVLREQRRVRIHFPFRA